MGLGSAIFGSKIIEAGTGIYTSGQQAKVVEAEAQANAALYREKAAMIGLEQDIEARQYQRLSGEIMSTSVVNIAASGIAMGGSAMASMVATQKQINIDAAIGKFNLEREKGFTYAQAEAEARGGSIRASQIRQAGYGRAFSSVLKGATQYALYRGAGSKSKEYARGSYSKQFQPISLLPRR